MDKEYFNLGLPAPTKKHIPEWYRKAESTFVDQSGNENAGLKKCMPFMDTLVSGYVLKTPVPIYINENKKRTDGSHLFNDSENGLQIWWDGPESLRDFIAERPKESGQTMPRPPGHYSNHFVFKGYWSIKTPRGYSLLMTNPLNRHDLPFTIASGIIDSDKFYASGNIPFFLKKDVGGVIPEGTPFAQLIPIKRAQWKMIENDPGIADSNMIQGNTVRQKGTEYKKMMWQRKKYD